MQFDNPQNITAFDPSLHNNYSNLLEYNTFATQYWKRPQLATKPSSITRPQHSISYPIQTTGFAPHESVKVQQYTPRSSQSYAATPSATFSSPSAPASASRTASHDQTFWSMQSGAVNQSMGGLATPAQQRQGLDRARSHQRTPSASTVASTGPPSPAFHYTTTIYPQVANSDYDTNSPAGNLWDLSASYLDSKSASAATNQPWANDFAYMPSPTSHMPAPHLAMKGFAIDHHNQNLKDMSAERPASSRHSSSSSGLDSPSTPRSAADEKGARAPTSSGSGKRTRDSAFLGTESLLCADPDSQRPNPSVQLYRTESAAYQDELYNPANFATTTPTNPARPANDLLTPGRSLVAERLQTANIARSASPSSAISRERSPFRQGSPLAPVSDAWSTSRQSVGTAAGMRQQQKQEREEAEYAQHRPPLNREPTKTISPKEAMLDYNDNDQQPLFQDSIPDGYRQHYGTAEPLASNYYGQDNAASRGVPVTSQQNIAGFRAATTSADGYSGGNVGQFGNFPPPSMQFQPQVQATIQAAHYQPATSMTTSFHPSTALTEPTPDFPAHLTSMESSMSDGVMASSQEQDSSRLPIQRPADTRANTGTYTCTYHGCSQRFDSQPLLQRHKRDYHRAQAASIAHTKTESDAASGTASAAHSEDDNSQSPRSSASPAPSASGLTSAALLARNSQAGPHKCTRVNPSTGKPCNTIFSRPYDLTRHEDTIHNNRKMKVRCPYCREEKSFSRNDALTRHMRVVHPEMENQGKRRSRD
ncbi:hypothetical protein B0A48_08283 [Cryoendolithus antarcticus]|uniref:C2H2-type domain-containing protein n=1 Tax=Cryoendolithus antarcticus TaxID=1507870 RepID=A0A1V8T571_9PEZI|nr:hypothetical protein B0A48_08283 [Cryoendolithus antarcticus]